MEESVIEVGDHKLFLVQPRPDAWSAAQCVEHLNAFSRLFIEELEAHAKDIAADADAVGPVRAGTIGSLLAKATGPSARFVKTKTFDQLVPRAELEAGSVVDDFVAFQKRWIALAGYADHRALARTKVRSLFAPVKMSVPAWMLFNLAHQQRHLKQAAESVEHVLSTK